MKREAAGEAAKHQLQFVAQRVGHGLDKLEVAARLALFEARSEARSTPASRASRRCEIPCS
jgi:hypothetical protein